MAIRLRTINGTRIALCAAQTDKQDGDLYLDDADHYALDAKFQYEYKDTTDKWRLCVGTFEYTPEWKLMETQHLHEIRDVSRLDKTNQLHSNSKLNWGVKFPAWIIYLFLTMCFLSVILIETYFFTWLVYTQLYERQGIEYSVLFKVCLFVCSITSPYLMIPFNNSIKSFFDWWTILDY